MCEKIALFINFAKPATQYNQPLIIQNCYVANLIFALPMTHRVLIIEDEIHSANRLKQLVEEFDDSFTVVAILSGIEESKQWLNKNPLPDLGLFDIQLSDGVCFDLIQQTNLRIPIIFVTAYDDRAIDAFELQAVDYLLKPVSSEKLRAALDKFKQQKTILDQSKLYNLMVSQQKSENKYSERLKTQIGNTLKVFNVIDIAYFYVQDKSVYAILHTGERFLLSYSLDEIEHMLNPKDFFRINRQFLISLKSISKMTVYSKSRIKLDLLPDPKMETITSVERSSEFKNWLGQ